MAAIRLKQMAQIAIIIAIYISENASSRPGVPTPIAHPSDHFHSESRRVIRSPFSPQKRTQTPQSDNDSSANVEQTFSLFTHSLSSLTKEIKQVALDLGLPAGISVRLANIKKNTATISADLSFTIGEISLCRYNARFYRFADGAPFLSGNIPMSTPDNDQTFDWPETTELLLVLTGEIGSRFDDMIHPTIETAQPCLYRLPNEWVPAYKVYFYDQEQRPYLAYADNSQVFFIQPMFLDVAGQVQGYDSNPKDATLVTETIELNGTGTLDSSRITMESNGVARAQASDSIFVADPTDATFPEQNVFLHATRMMDWFISKGFQFDGDPITVKIHQIINGSTNNALYLPPTSQTSQARILVGDGDGQILANLALDGDVVSHELSHHIVFQHLKSTEQVESETEILAGLNHSLAIHEGLADFFTFARTGNPCLGESICPGVLEQSACFQKAQCLRTADNSILYNSSEYWALTGAHLKGQVVSGLLWGLRENGTITQDQTDQLVFKALSFLPTQAVYQDLILALLLADRDLYSEQFHCHIQTVAKQWGFSGEVERIGQEKCGGPPATAPLIPTSSPETAQSNTSNKSKGGIFCGIAAGLPAGSPVHGSIFLLFIMLFPALRQLYGLLKPS